LIIWETLQNALASTHIKQALPALQLKLKIKEKDHTHAVLR
jgi:hypothetical protein